MRTMTVGRDGRVTPGWKVIAKSQNGGVVTSEKNNILVDLNNPPEVVNGFIYEAYPSTNYSGVYYRKPDYPSKKVLVSVPHTCFEGNVKTIQTEVTEDPLWKLSIVPIWDTGVLVVGNDLPEESWTVLVNRGGFVESWLKINYDLNERLVKEHV